MELDFDKMNGLVPAIIQDNETRKVLMLGFMYTDAERIAQLYTTDSGKPGRSRVPYWYRYLLGGEKRRTGYVPESIARFH